MWGRVNETITQNQLVKLEPMSWNEQQENSN